jgi:hypothetical protein
MLRSTMKPIRPNRPTSKNKHENQGQLCPALHAAPHTEPDQSTAHRFVGNSVAITVSKPRQKQHLPYLIFALKPKIARGMGANHRTPPPWSSVLQQSMRRKWHKSPANRAITTQKTIISYTFRCGCSTKQNTQPGNQPFLLRPIRSSLERARIGATLPEVQAKKRGPNKLRQN